MQLDKARHVRLKLSCRYHAPKYLKRCITIKKENTEMLKISKIARHTVIHMGKCPEGSENHCGIMWRMS